MLLFPIYKCDDRLTFASEGVMPRKMAGIVEAPHGSELESRPGREPVLVVPNPDGVTKVYLGPLAAVAAARRGVQGMSYRPHEGGG